MVTLTGVVFIATRCLHGKEVRERFDEEVANLYHDLDNGFTPLAWFLPAWIPFPRYHHIIISHSCNMSPLSIFIV